MAAVTRQTAGGRVVYNLYAATADEHSGMYISHADEAASGETIIPGVTCDISARVRREGGDYRVAVNIGKLVIGQQ